ncbi:MAG TPA: OmpH family outer membrane protein [Acetobacteraceae bacterium]|nr:OmpH family outer membrane protein [Acetobacteraceae bacterium]
MHHIRLFVAAALLTGAASLSPPPAIAQQQGQDWFVPGQQRSGQKAPARAPARSQPSHAPLPLPLAPQQGAEAEPPSPPIQVQLPPAPDVPALPKGTSPPAAVVGVLSLAEISRNAVAAQQVDKALSERMAKLHDDAQKEQGAWREVQQQLASERAKLSADQIRAKERDLQERVTNAQRQFRDRNRIIQEAAQYARAQIERTLRSVVIQVSESHGINLVLHQEQVVLNYPAFDITQQVVEQLNKILPSVVVPPDGVPVAKMPGAVPVAQGQPAPGQPAAAGPAASGQPAPGQASAPSGAAATPAPTVAAPPAPPPPPPAPPASTDKAAPSQKKHP